MNSPVLRTLYKNKEHLREALRITFDLFTKKDPLLIPNNEGCCLFEEVSAALIKKCPDLNYINRNHIVELYFKDTSRSLFIRGENLIGYRTVQYIKPPEILYFGTVTDLLDKMKTFGIMSHSRHYIKLFDSPEKAIDNARRFANDEINLCAIKVDAAAAHNAGIAFSSYNTGEYVVTKIEPKYIIEILGRG